jgi:Xaa-Pro dipeptidase
MPNRVPLNELNTRIRQFRIMMTTQNPDWEIAVVFSKINQYYFTGTMQEGMLIIPRECEPTFWVRRSYDRAIDESFFPNIKSMESYRDAAASKEKLPDTVYLETEFVPIAMLHRFQKYFPFKNIKSCDFAIGSARAVKSQYELDLMIKSGEIHRRVLENRAPSIMREGISEVEFATELYSVLMQEGHHGLVRFTMFDTEVILGHIAFGDSSIYPTSFNGPGGNMGISPAIPHLGNPNRKLRKGDLVFLDVGCGVNGYHTDKTSTYMFGRAISDQAMDAHKQCVDIQNEIASLLKPGAIPSEIYEKIINELDPEFLENFMGFGKRQVKFLGHGIGLTVDEIPVLAKGFDSPIQENMVFAIEPKKGIKDVGMVGIENTFIVTPNGGKCITGDNPGLILVE